MSGRVIIVTGANSGVGYETAKQLCEGGNDVILACRNEEKGNAAVESILNCNPNALATFMKLDVSDMASVRQFVDDFHATGKKLHVLVNNAGIFLMGGPSAIQYSVDNFELTMATNHMGSFLLTNLLLDDLKKTGAESGDSRIVNISSSLHSRVHRKHKRPMEPLVVENFFLRNADTFNGDQAYKNSKLSTVLFTYELHKKLPDTGVTVNCLCPGFIPTTDLMRGASAGTRFFLRYILHGMLRFTKVTRTLDQGVRAVIDLIHGENIKGVSGKYFIDRQETDSSEESRDEDLQKSVWELSARYVHLDGYEPLDAPPPPPPEEPKKDEKEVKKDDKETDQAQPTEGTSDPIEARPMPDGADGKDLSDKKDDKNEEATGKKDDKDADSEETMVKTEDVKKDVQEVADVPEVADGKTVEPVSEGLNIEVEVTPPSPEVPGSVETG